MSLVGQILSYCEGQVLKMTELNHIMDRDVNLLSGGELQRFAIGTVCVQQADVYGLTPSFGFNCS